MTKKLRIKSKKTIRQKVNGANRAGEEDALECLQMKASLTYFSMFQSSSSYILDDFNSIHLFQNRIYNLLKMKPLQLRPLTTKCKCPKSRCLARYCDCFVRGKICSLQCQCLNCENQTYTKQLIRSSLAEKSQVGCRCSKSECSKNYCQCFQKGECCNSKCKCLNCRNTL